MSYATTAELRDYLDQVPEYGQQRLTITGSPAGGTFTLTYEGTASAALNHNATATAVQAALRAIAAIGSTGVNVTGRPGGPWLAKFQGALATDAALLALGTNSLTGGTTPSITIAAAQDARLQKILDRATAIIDTYLGVTFPTAEEDAEQVVYGDGTDYLVPPAFVAGSASLVEAPASYTVPDYIEQGAALVVTRNSLLGTLHGAQALGGRLHTPLGGWLAGVPYTVTATFGYAAIPDDIKEACLEIAVDLFRFKDAGSIKMVGVEGAGVVSGKGLPATAKIILDRRLADLSVPGVW